jgi:diguanylate cyclase (GGDEF)-like protein
LLFFDIDHFKLCNDALGHQAGDACLRMVADVLKQHARRPFDLAARYGGEEFVLILFNMTQAQLLATAEAIRAQIEAMASPNPGAPRGILTISAGAARVAPTAGRSIHALIQMADEALFAAKNDGRNCVRASDQELCHVTTGRFKRRNPLRVVG